MKIKNCLKNAIPILLTPFCEFLLGPLFKNSICRSKEPKIIGILIKSLNKSLGGFPINIDFYDNIIIYIFSNFYFKFKLKQFYSDHSFNIFEMNMELTTMEF